MGLSWFRLHAEFDSDPKVQMLSEAMQRRLVMLFCSRCRNETLQERSLAFQWRISEDDLQETKKLFIANGFINDQWKVLNWDKRQFRSDSSTARVQRYRELNKDETLQKRSTKQDETVTVTPQNRTEQKQKKPKIPCPALPDVPEKAVILAAFGYYCQKFQRNQNQYTLTRPRLEKAVSRFRERLAIHHNPDQAKRDFAKAIDNLAGSDYHRENGFIDWTDHIFKSQETFEKRLNWKPNGGSNGNGYHRTKTDGNLEAAREAVFELTGDDAGLAGAGETGFVIEGHRKALRD